MEYYAGLDVSMEDTHVCVVDRDGAIVLEAKTASLPQEIRATLLRAPPCKLVVFETGRMAPMLYHGLDALGVRAFTKSPKPYPIHLIANIKRGPLLLAGNGETAPLPRTLSDRPRWIEHAAREKRRAGLR